MIISAVAIMRPLQWLKNGFVLMPLLFSGLFVEIHFLINSLIACACFCAASSAVYIHNDICDIEADAQHPTKCQRPLASGAMTKIVAFVLAIILASLSIGISWLLLGKNVAAIISAYLFTSFLYSVFAKYIPVLDIFFISFGFILRILAGTLAIGVDISIWMIITCLSLTLYLATHKRLSELRNQVTHTRKVLSAYSIETLNFYTQTSAICTIMFYSLFCLIEKPSLAFSIPIVIFGIFRYWLITDLHKRESPIDNLMDTHLITALLLWLASCIWMI